MTRARWLLPTIAVLAFVSLGLPDTLLGVAWPSLRRDLDLAVSDLGWIVACGMTGYLVSCLASGGVVRRLGIGRLLAGSSALVALSLGATASARDWLVLPAAGFAAGVGAGAIDTGINAFAAQSFSPRMVSWLHAAYGVGATTGPALMTAVLLRGAGWRAGYLAVATLLGALAIIEAAMRDRWNGPAVSAVPDDPPPPDLLETLREPAVRWSVVLFFLYTGLEVTTAQWSFALLSEARGIDIGAAGAMVSGYWMSLTVGRIVCGVLARRLGSHSILAASIGAIPVLALGFVLLDSSAASAIGLAALGLAYASVFPLLVSDTPSRVGSRFADQAMGLQIAAAYLGAAALPALTGFLVAAFGLVAAPLLLPIGGAALLAAYRWSVPARSSIRRRAPAAAVPASSSGCGACSA